LQGHIFPYTLRKGNTLSFNQVQEFNDTYGVNTRTEASVRVRESKLRFELIREEFQELLDAFKACDIVEIVDALGDIRYVVIGAAQVFGIAQQVSDAYYGDNKNYGAELVSAETQAETLKFLRTAILREDTESVVDILAFILKAVDDAARHYHVNLDEIVDAIHKSNMSKLGENGEVIRRESDNKVLKGPNYVTPTADIENLLFGEADVDAS
jgi:predicted HAD superfamily Cof-like phosphohydrolase